MIKIIGLNKYFNKRSSNEYHALKDINLEFGETGLVTIFGKSGSGKTTLLNIIGLMDKFDSGQIVYDDIIFNRYATKKADELRNRKIGYIFQNYNLVSSKNVFDNVAMPLHLIGEHNKDEIKRKVEYALKAVGLDKYKKRSVNALSGGQMQRVAIARAIVKNPDVIIADEPTGNLDSNNTFDCMNIIKKISKEKLVILVSHEKNLVDYYSDRIIEIQDGTIISDKENVGDVLNHSDDRNIYLKDYDNKSGNIDGLKINIYDDKKYEKDINLDFVIRDGEIYLKSNASNIHLVDDSSEIKFLDASRKEFEENLKNNTADFSLDELKREEEEGKKKGYISIFSTIKESFLNSSTFLKRSAFTVIAFILSTIIFTFNYASLTSSVHIREKDYLTVSRNTISVELSKSEMTRDEELLEILKNDSNVIGIKGADYNAYNELRFNPSNFYQTGNSYSRISVQAYLVDASKYPYEVEYGKKLSNDDEIVISRWIAESIIEDNNAQVNGFISVDNLVGFEIILNSKKYTIAGIAKEKSIIALVSNATYNAIYDSDPIDNSVYFVETLDKDATAAKLTSFSRVRDELKNSKTTYFKALLEQNLTSIIFMSIMIVAISLYIILMVRSSMFKKIKEIGILRTVGAKKGDVLKIFVGDMIAVTSKSSLITYAIVSLIIVLIKARLGLSSIGMSILTVTPLSFVVGLVLIYGLNILASIIPVSILMSKTPIEIVKKYDI